MKKAIAAAALLLCLLLTACAAPKAAPSCAQVAQAVAQAQPMAELTELGEKQIAKYLLLEAAQYAEASVRLDASRATPECVCVFSAASKDALPALESALAAYRDGLLAQYRDYRPEEAPKLEGAVLRTQGLQTVLIVSADAEKAAQALDSAWK